MKDTSWESSNRWYDDIVGDKGHYYHEKIIIPRVLQLLALKPGDKILDLGCGQGVFSKVIPKGVEYEGVDLSKSLVAYARNRSPFPFYVGDITLPLEKIHKGFTHAIMILVVQNLENEKRAFLNAATHLKPGGILIIVLNHPCFRIPRQSSWGIDPIKKIQYRRIDHYMQSLEIPIKTHPGKEENKTMTWSFHRPLSVYIQGLTESGFMIDKIEEWVSDKKSYGKNSKLENQSRENFPLFLTLRAVKT